MTVKISLMEIQNTGYAKTPDGPIQSWKVRFHLDGADFVGVEIVIPVKGPRTKPEATQHALSTLQRFLSESYAAAKNFEEQGKVI